MRLVSIYRTILIFVVLANWLSSSFIIGAGTFRRHRHNNNATTHNNDDNSDKNNNNNNNKDGRLQRMFRARTVMPTNPPVAGQRVKKPAAIKHTQSIRSAPQPSTRTARTPKDHVPKATTMPITQAEKQSRTKSIRGAKEKTRESTRKQQPQTSPRKQSPPAAEQLRLSTSAENSLRSSISRRMHLSRKPKPEGSGGRIPRAGDQTAGGKTTAAIKRRAAMLTIKRKKRSEVVTNRLDVDQSLQEKDADNDSGKRRSDGSIQSDGSGRSRRGVNGLLAEPNPVAVQVTAVYAQDLLDVMTLLMERVQWRADGEMTLIGFDAEERRRFEDIFALEYANFISQVEYAIPLADDGDAEMREFIQRIANNHWAQCTMFFLLIKQSKLDAHRNITQDKKLNTALMDLAMVGSQMLERYTTIRNAIESREDSAEIASLITLLPAIHLKSIYIFTFLEPPSIYWADSTLYTYTNRLFYFAHNTVESMSQYLPRNRGFDLKLLDRKIKVDSRFGVNGRDQTVRITINRHSEGVEEKRLAAHLSLYSSQLMHMISERFLAGVHDYYDDSHYHSMRHLESVRWAVRTVWTKNLLRCALQTDYEDIDAIDVINTLSNTLKIVLHFQDWMGITMFTSSDVALRDATKNLQKVLRVLPVVESLRDKYNFIIDIIEEWNAINEPLLGIHASSFPPVDCEELARPPPPPPPPPPSTDDRRKSESDVEPEEEQPKRVLRVMNPD